jgi:methyl-accepting chemotaxis protein
MPAISDHNPPTLASPRANVLARRLLLTFGAVVLLTLAGAGIGIRSLAKVDEATRETILRSSISERMAEDAYRLQSINAARYKAMALSAEPEVGEILAADIQATDARFRVLLQDLADRLHADTDRERLAATEAAARDFDAAVKELVAARDSGLTERIRTVHAKRFEPSAAALLAAVSGLAVSQREAIDAAGRHIEELSGSARLALALFGAAAVLLGGGLALWLVRSICRPIRLAGDTAQRVARLDLRDDIRGHARDEAGQMLLALGAMQGALRQLVVRVRESVQGVRSAAGEIAHGNADLSARTESAAASLQQTAAALAQLMHGVRQSSEEAAHAGKMADTAAAVAVQGGEAMSQVVGTMQDIQRASHKVADIVGVIDGIAFQTNILALNAAVEAARAGESGRGFAVVAAEVRQLATRSAAAAREIKGLIGDTVQRVETGTALVDDAGRTMARIMDAVQRAAGTLGTITAAAEAQSAEIAQINSAVARLDRMTQQNAALVEESSAASEGLHDQARGLDALISRFVLPEDGPVVPTDAAPPAPASAVAPSRLRLRAAALPAIAG